MKRLPSTAVDHICETCRSVFLAAPSNKRPRRFCSKSCKTSMDKRTHGWCGTPTYKTWCSMIGRCYNTTDNRFAYYGGRGISVCAHWRMFENFLADMGERPQGTTIDRINNDGNYEPGNCRWSIRSIQSQNRRSCRINAVGAILIRHLYQRGETRKHLAHAFDVSIELIDDVIKRRSWIDPFTILEIS